VSLSESNIMVGLRVEIGKRISKSREVECGKKNKKEKEN